MVTQISEDEFLTSPGVGDWQVNDGFAVAHFHTGSFSAGVEFLTEIARIADDANHHPDVELTYPMVTLRLITHDAGGVLTTLDVALAQDISRVADEMGFEAEPRA